MTRFSYTIFGYVPNTVLTALVNINLRKFHWPIRVIPKNQIALSKIAIRALFYYAIQLDLAEAKDEEVVIDARPWYRKLF